jgi:predicted transposase/invertase (TIGR01784 family)
VPLELTVKVYNINQGHNEPIIRRCETLAGYSAFIATVRKYEGQGRSREEAIKAAIKECINQDILKEFLETHGTEVTSMLYTEWNLEDALAVEREEGLEEGLEKGRQEGWEEGWEEGVQEIARNFKKLGIPVEQIAQGTGLSPEEITAL